MLLRPGPAWAWCFVLFFFPTVHLALVLDLKTGPVTEAGMIERRQLLQGSVTVGTGWPEESVWISVFSQEKGHFWLAQPGEFAEAFEMGLSRMSLI